jgi:surface polysaccharide O-acyltransferase-like enzyme
VDNDLKKEIKETIFYGGNIWFVYVLFEIVVLFPLLKKIINDRKSYAILLTLILMGVYWLWGQKIEFLCISRVTYYMVYFLIGHILRMMNETTPSIFEKMSQVFSKYYVRFLAVLVLALADAGFIFAEQSVTGLSQYLLGVTVALLGSYIFYLLVCSVQTQTLRDILKDLGQYSLQIYLFNGYFIAVSRTLIHNILNISNVVILASINFFVGIVCNYIWCFWITKIKIVKVLCGKR